MIADSITIIPRRLIVDDRGVFIKCVTGAEKDLPPRTGEVYVVIARAGQRRGDHYHLAAREWFTVVAGRGRLSLMDVRSGERLDLHMSASQPASVCVPPGLAHVFINDAEDGLDLVIVAYTDRPYEPADTVPHVVPA
ncbi:MAG: hypothetical protein RL105_1820 [Verrucomicrobiota bacterium]|jgi:dTDP-4-dehydrorhamnose 3,5-epimerase-like enzyme